MSQQFGVAFFFASYLLFVGVALMNVVVAVLLEKMVSQDDPHHAVEKAHDSNTLESERMPEHLEKVCLDIELDCILLKQQLFPGITWYLLDIQCFVRQDILE